VDHGTPDDGAAGFRERALAELVRVPFRPPWWLRGGRRQTLLGARASRVRPPALLLERWETPDGDFLRVHLDAGDPRRPLLVVLHGLEGSLRSGSVAGMARRAESLGWGVVVPEHRSCGGEMNRLPRAYHSGATEDLSLVVERLRARFAGRRMFAYGVSLGGNMLMKWLGERGDDVPPEVAAAAAVSPPFDLAASARNADEALGGVMARAFLRTLVPKALEKARRFPGLLDERRVRAARSFREYDQLVTAPLHGFRDAEEYWVTQSCRRFLAGVCRPTLVVAARDDPLHPAATIPGAELAANPHLVPLVVDHGGHAAFLAAVAGGERSWRLERWAEGRALRFFELCDARASTVAGAALNGRG